MSRRSHNRSFARTRRTLVALAAACALCAGSAASASTPGQASDGLAVAGPRAELLALAERAADRYLADHSVTQPQLLTVIDYSLPSTEPRLWVIDRARGRVLFQGLVAHGRGSGENYATRFSNLDGSLESSLGLFLTADTYLGRNGYSLRLEGLEPGVNDRARERTLVLHGAPYVSAEFAHDHGRLGRSWGCPALAPDLAPAVIDRIRGGSLMFVYARDPSWLAGSRYLVVAAPAAPARSFGAFRAAAPR